VTTRGMRDKEMVQIASFIAEVLDSYPNNEIEAGVARQVEDLCHKFPIYRERISKE